MSGSTRKSYMNHSGQFFSVVTDKCLLFIQSGLYSYITFSTKCDCPVLNAIYALNIKAAFSLGLMIVWPHLTLNVHCVHGP